MSSRRDVSVSKARPSSLRLATTITFGALVAASAWAGGGHGKDHLKPPTCTPAPGSEALAEPCRVIVEPDQAPADLFVKFGITNVQFTQPSDPSGNSRPPRSQQIWARTYGYRDSEGAPKSMIPGPNFYFKPGSFLQLNLINLLNDEEFSKLGEFETTVNRTFDTDEIMNHVGHEVNVPHNPNDTNLHTHGLHVDPSEDDVNLIILPKDENPARYAWDLQPFIREGEWLYQYRIPSFHMPGTHWYHAHKHGSTSVHIENGMAGALIIQPTDPADDILPSLPPQHDRVLMAQEIENYGLQQGSGRGKLVDEDDDQIQGGAAAPPDGGFKARHKQSPITTLNGQVEPTLQLVKGQAERWRLINGAANHHGFAYVWLGKKVQPSWVDGKAPTAGTHYFEGAPLRVAAVDGITLSSVVTTTPRRPLFLGPANRADLLLQFDAEGSYALIKNFPPDVRLVAPADCRRGKTHCWKTQEVAAKQDSISNPYLLPQSSSTVFQSENGCPVTSPKTDNQGKPLPLPNFNHLLVCWEPKQTWGPPQVPEPVLPQPKPEPTWTSIVPLLRVEEETVGASKLLDVKFDTSFEPGDVGWTPVALPDLGGGGTDFAILLKIEVTAGQPDYSLPDQTVLDAHLKRISPTGNPEKAPAYASPVDNDEILQARTVIFDISGAGADIFDTKDCPKGQKPPCEVETVRQFTLNGRQFAVADSIGNRDALSLINQPLPVGKIDGGMAGGGDTQNFFMVDPVEHHGNWINQLWANPSNYQPMTSSPLTVASGSKNPCLYQKTSKACPKSGSAVTFGYPVLEAGAKPPVLSFEDITGIEGPSVLNPSFAGYKEIANIPGEPVATTAEEWILINNSPIGHPFHIHINPFFITEIGQLSYEKFKDGYAWAVRTVDPDPNGTPEDATQLPVPTGPIKLKGTNTMGWMLNNWWDTMVIPPSGYLKIRYWINVPMQNWDGSQLADNVNRFGNWVYHCHILRHEDRGMMMIVGAQPKVEK
ncbi:MAG: multicopper oxidase domain-containing protein [Thermoanaerobaculia bacterium]|nr:multicopper oxidase domain-containing protein [Thermoanaerobaculia bacterium]